MPSSPIITKLSEQQSQKSEPSADDEVNDENAAKKHQKGSSKMNRFSVASHNVNLSRIAAAEKSYKEQLMSVINAAGNSTANLDYSSDAVKSVSSDESIFNRQQSDLDNNTNSNEYHASDFVMQSREFGRGEGEIDMLMGFFMMNGACIAFFLLFGICVICNCAQRKPKFHTGINKEQKKRKKPTISKLVASTMLPFSPAKSLTPAANHNSTSGNYLNNSTNKNSFKGDKPSETSPRGGLFKSFVNRAMRKEKANQNNISSIEASISIDDLESTPISVGNENRHQDPKTVKFSQLMTKDHQFFARDLTRRLSLISEAENTENKAEVPTIILRRGSIISPNTGEVFPIQIEEYPMEVRIANECDCLQPSTGCCSVSNISPHDSSHCSTARGSISSAGCKTDSPEHKISTSSLSCFHHQQRNVSIQIDTNNCPISPTYARVFPISHSIPNNFESEPISPPPDLNHTDKDFVDNTEHLRVFLNQSKEASYVVRRKPSDIMTYTTMKIPTIIEEENGMKSTRKPSLRATIIMMENENEAPIETVKPSTTTSSDLTVNGSDACYTPRSAKRQIREMRQETITEDCPIEYDEGQQISVVRHNLLGPLSFDDLYYV